MLALVSIYCGECVHANRLARYTSWHCPVKGYASSQSFPDPILGSVAVVQVVKARVLTVDAAGKRLRLSLAPKSAASSDAGGAGADALGGLQPGDIVEGAVRSVTLREVSLPWLCLPTSHWQIHAAHAEQQGLGDALCMHVTCSSRGGRRWAGA
jgi:hypothetical protein